MPRRRAYSALLLLLAAPIFSPPLVPAETDVAGLMRRAAEERKRGDYSAAARTYREILQQAPGFYEAHLFLGDTLRKRRLDAEAEQEFEAARKIRPAEPHPYAGLSDLRRETFRFGEALAVLEEGRKAVPPEKREQLVVAQGTTLRQAGEPASAIEVLLQGARDHPTSHRIRVALAWSLEAQGRVSEAVEAWTAAHGLAPDDADIRSGLEEARAVAERLGKAESAVNAPGATSRAWEDLARVRYAARQFPQAVEAARIARRKGGHGADLALLCALALENAGRNDEADSELQAIPEDAPEHLLAAYHRAYLARMRGDAAAEEKIWLEVLRSDPQDPTVRTMLVLNWKRRDVLEPRIADLRRGTGRKKTSLADRLLEGMALEEMGRDREAADLYAELFLADPLHPEPPARLSALLGLRPSLLRDFLEAENRRLAPRRLVLSQLLLTAGRNRAALDELREAARLLPDRAETHLLLAAAVDTTRGDPAEAARELAQAARLAPTSPWVRLQVGLSHLKSGDFEEAIREAERAVALAPRLPETHQLLGLSRRQAGDDSGAARELSRALSLDPMDSTGIARFQLALALSATGDRLQARSTLEGNVPPFPELIYHLAWAFARSTFLDRTFAGQDWLSWRNRFEGRLSTPQEAYSAVAEMLSSLRDPYTRLRGAEETEVLYLHRRSEQLETDRTGTPRPSSRSVVAEDLEENLGYIRLTNLSDPTARDSIRKALEKMAERDGLILDLRGNAGGVTADADAIAGFLLQSGEEVAREQDRAGKSIRKTPSRRPILPRTPMVILTDRRTASAAERLAAGLQGAGRATVVGEGTFGKGKGQMTRLLPGGGMVLVTAVESLRRSGEPIQDDGVTPDVESGDTSLEKAKEILKKGRETPPSPPPTPGGE